MSVATSHVTCKESSKHLNKQNLEENFISGYISISYGHPFLKLNHIKLDTVKS